MDNAAGEDLSWFWNEWFLTTWKLDQSVKSIDYNDGDPSKGALITIENLEGMALPVTIAVKEENGKMGRVELPAEIWQRGGTWTFAYKSTSKISYAIIDPDHVLPDINPENNSFSGVAVPKDVNAATVINNYIAAIGGEKRLKDVQDLTINGEGTVQGISVVRVSKYKGFDKFNQDITVPNFNNQVITHVVINGDSLNVINLRKPVPIPADQKNSVKARYVLFPELNFSKPGYMMKMDSTLKIVGDQLAYLVKVTAPDGTRVNYYYDQKTGFKIKQFTDVPNSTVMEFGNYQDIQTGIKIPFSEKTVVVGQPIEFKVKSTTVNSGLSNDIFK